MQATEQACSVIHSNYTHCVKIHVGILHYYIVEWDDRPILWLACEDTVLRTEISINWPVSEQLEILK